MNMHHYWKFRGGKVCFVRSSEDTAQVAAALTPWPRNPRRLRPTARPWTRTAGAGRDRRRP